LASLKDYFFLSGWKYSGSGMMSYLAKRASSDYLLPILGQLPLTGFVGLHTSSSWNKFLGDYPVIAVGIVFYHESPRGRQTLQWQFIQLGNRRFGFYFIIVSRISYVHFGAHHLEPGIWA
jgi:hypothetical protein